MRKLLLSEHDELDEFLFVFYERGCSVTETVELISELNDEVQQALDKQRTLDKQGTPDPTFQNPF